jgi:hypothetical protein
MINSILDSIFGAQPEEQEIEETAMTESLFDAMFGVK